MFLFIAFGGTFEANLLLVICLRLHMSLIFNYANQHNAQLYPTNRSKNPFPVSLLQKSLFNVIPGLTEHDRDLIRGNPNLRIPPMVTAKAGLIPSLPRRPDPGFRRKPHSF